MRNVRFDTLYYSTAHYSVSYYNMSYYCISCTDAFKYLNWFF